MNKLNAQIKQNHSEHLSFQDNHGFTCLFIITDKIAIRIKFNLIEIGSIGIFHE